MEYALIVYSFLNRKTPSTMQDNTTVFRRILTNNTFISYIYSKIIKFEILLKCFWSLSAGLLYKDINRIK